MMCSVLAATFCLACSCAASADSEIIGKLQGAAPAHACAELESAGAERIQLRVPVDGMGEFRFDRVPAGRYELRLRGTSSELLYRQPLIVEEAVIYVRASVGPPRLPVAPGTVSAAELARKVPRAAQKELRKAREEMARGRLREAIPHLEKTIRLDPEFARAYNYLGACLGTLGEFDAAAKALRRAVELDPASVEARANLASALRGARHGL